MEPGKFHDIIQPFLAPGFILQSRVHEIRSYIKSQGRVCIKREDELSSGIAGSKFRKYASLLPYLKNHAFEEVIVIGGSNSNNVLAAMQLLREWDINFRLVLLESNRQKPVGNELLIKMLLKDDPIHYIIREEWGNAEDTAKTIAERGLRTTFILPEGAAVIQAMPGAMTLGIDILQNELQTGKNANHIFIDSGTGVTAIGLVLALEFMDISNKEIHITLIAGTEREFLPKLENFRNALPRYLNIPPPTGRVKLHFYKPVTSSSFGSMNKTVLENTIVIAQEEGILMEPVYSVKHLMTAKATIENRYPEGNILIINNGGSLGLAGYEESLQSYFGEKPRKNQP